jgi:hypothetical protein
LNEREKERKGKRKIYQQKGEERNHTTERERKKLNYKKRRRERKKLNDRNRKSLYYFIERERERETMQKLKHEISSRVPIQPFLALGENIEKSRDRPLH